VVWIPIGAWIFAALLMVVILGYCGYEISWKANRLRGDLARAQDDAERLEGLGAHLIEAQQRLGRPAAPSHR
jgi:hypothetical protein